MNFLHAKTESTVSFGWIRHLDRRCVFQNRTSGREEPSYPVSLPFRTGNTSSCASPIGLKFGGHVPGGVMSQHRRPSVHSLIRLSSKSYDRKRITVLLHTDTYLSKFVPATVNVDFSDGFSKFSLQTSNDSFWDNSLGGQVGPLFFCHCRRLFRVLDVRRSLESRRGHNG